MQVITIRVSDEGNNHKSAVSISYMRVYFSRISLSYVSVSLFGFLYVNEFFAFLLFFFRKRTVPYFSK